MSVNDWYFKFRNLIAKKLPQVYRLCNTHKSFVKFLIAGGIAGVGNLILLFLFHGLLGWEIILSTSLAFILAFVISFVLQKLWTFRNKDKKKTFIQFCLYSLTALVNLNLNAFLMHILVNQYQVWYLLAQLVINLFLGLINFVVYKFIIFKKRNETCCPQKTTGR